MDHITVKVKRLSENARELPAYATDGSAGVDLKAMLPEPVTLQPGQSRRIPTGIAIELPGPQVAAFIFPRSGLASKYGVTLSNSVGVIDSDYRGEIQVPLINLGPEPFTIRQGERIAQMVFMPVLLAKLQWQAELSETQRGSGGFGSTGTQ